MKKAYYVAIFSSTPAGVGREIAAALTKVCVSSGAQVVLVGDSRCFPAGASVLSTAEFVERFENKWRKVRRAARRLKQKPSDFVRESIEARASEVLKPAPAEPAQPAEAIAS